MKKIMVVDDTKDTLELVEAVLSIEGFDVEAHDNAKDAFASLKKRHIPDLLLLDIRMPNFNGVELCKKIREEEKIKNLKIVFFTASSEANMNLLKETGVLGFIFKPFDNEILIKEIYKYIK